MIRILEKNVADKIAAGEVIERPVSIVKELIENAVDSGADSIICEIRQGGKSYIRVTDNGCGIPEEDVETAFLRHATSKIEKAADLDSIKTLGFRGEALASIAAVTHTELITKTKDAKMGTRLIINGGLVTKNERTGCPDGTTVIVTDLFYNTPARLKFMKSDASEAAMIIDFMSQIALCYKDIKIRLINKDKILFSTLGDGNRLNSIIRIYPEVRAEDMVLVSNEAEGLKITGYSSSPAFSKASRVSQIFFVNGRVVNSKVMEKGVSLAYRERLFEGRYPVCYLFLEVDPGKLDVNIHPNKREVRFDEEARIAEFISESIVNGLSTISGVVDAAKPIYSKIEKTAAFTSNRNLFKYGNNESPYKKSESNIDSTGKHQRINEIRLPDKKDVEQVDIKTLLSTIDNLPSFLSDEKKTGIIQEKTTNSEYLNISESKTDYDSPDTINRPVSSDNIEIYEPALKPFDFNDLKVNGVIFDTYITATDEKHFYLIDQHAAQERIFYEKLVNQYDSLEKVRQPVMVPLILEAGLSSAEKSEAWMDSLNRIGFTISDFGRGTYRISEIPMFMELSEAEDFIMEYVENIENSTDYRNTVVINKLIMMSCKAAIKAHDRLSLEEINQLIKDLGKCKNPFSCPHGRPTAIKLSLYDIERMFKRA